MNLTCFIFAWPENNGRYNMDVLFHTPRARLRVTTYVTLWVCFLCMGDNLENQLMSTELEKLLSCPKTLYSCVEMSYL